MERCEWMVAGGGECGAEATGGGGMDGLAWCERHKPCACGYVMTERGKVWRDRAQSPFPEEEMVHSHACCWMDGARNSSLVIVRDAAPDAGDDLGPFQRIGRGDLFGMTAGEIHADRYGAEDAANFTDEGGQS